MTTQRSDFASSPPAGSTATSLEKTNDQFSRSAAAYLTSAVHSQGEDLKALVDIATQMQAKQVLDLGCGAGHVTFALAPHVQSVTAYDLSEQMLEVVNREAKVRHITNLATQQGQVESLPFPDQSFCLVCTRFSAHHWQDVRLALKEAFRVLKPNGRFVLIDTCSVGRPLIDTHMQALELLRDSSHVRNYTAAEWTGMLDASGFDFISSRMWRILLEFDAWVKRAQTPAVYVDALRLLFQTAPREVRYFFEISDGASFRADSVLLEAKKP